MRLLIVRHAIAEARGTPGVPDGARQLTAEGRRRFRRVARRLARLVGRPDAILTSPLARARQTADLLAEACGGAVPEELQALAVGDHAALEEALRRFTPGALVAVVGHEPWVSMLLAHLLDARSPERVGFRKGGAALVELAGALSEGGTLQWFARPRLLRG